MAKIVKPKEEQTTPVRSEAQVLFPNLEIFVQGERVVVKELPLRLFAQYNDVITALKKGFDDLKLDTINKNDNYFNDILDMLLNNWNEIILLTAISCDKSIEWIESLSNEEQENLALTWWNVNSGFFIRRLHRKGLMQGVLNRSAPIGG